MKPLYALVAQHKELVALDPEEIDEQTLRDTLEGLTGEIQAKATSCAAYSRNLEAFAGTIEEAAKQMAARAAALRRKAEVSRAYLLAQMQALGITKIDSPELTVSIKRNPPSVVVAPDAKLPDELLIWPQPAPPKPDKKAIKAKLEAGESVPGCHLENGERLEIK